MRGRIPLADHAPQSLSLCLIASNIAPPSTMIASILPQLMSTCSHQLQSPHSVPTLSKAPTPVGSPSPTAPPLPIHPFSTASNPPESTAALPARHALLEERMSSFTTQKIKPDTMVSGRAKGVSRMILHLLGRGRRLLQER